MHVVNKVKELLRLVIVCIISEVFDGRKDFLLTSDAVVARLRKFYHVLDVLLGRAV